MVAPVVSGLILGASIQKILGNLLAIYGGTGHPFVRIHGRKLVLRLIRLNNVLAVSGMVTGKDYWVGGVLKTGNL